MEKIFYRVICIVFVVICFIESIVSLVEAPDGSVCFDNCNGHGTCVDYSCQCDTGYHGDDCNLSYLQDESNIVPILGAGHFNVSKKEFPAIVKKSSYLLVGFSSRSCHRCIQVESNYAKISDYLLSTLHIPFARADADELRGIALEYEAQDVPSLVFFKKQRGYLYKGFHDANHVITYINKQVNPPVTLLKSTEEVENYFHSFVGNTSLSLSTVAVVGFFSSHLDMEEDEYEDFIQLAKDMQTKEDVYFGVVTNKLVSNVYKKRNIIDRTPSILLQRDSNVTFAINLDEFIGESYGLREWIERKSVPLVGKLTHMNFRAYEKLGLPMLLLFLDLTHEHNVILSSSSSSSGNMIVVGGKSGGVLNEVLLEEFRKLAKEYNDKIIFVYVDGVAHQDQMRSLGIYGGAEGLPSLAFNTKDGRQVPFPDELPINYDTLNRYCAEFLTGKMKTPKDSLDFRRKYELSTIDPINPKNRVSRKPAKQAPETQTGVAEQFNDNLPGSDAIIEITSENWQEVAMIEDKDVVLVLHSYGCESCAHFAVYYKRMARRFRELNIPSLIIAQMNVTNDSPPPDLNIIVGKLPLFMILPAGAKHPPWSYYSGVSKIQPMMKWIQQQAGIKFELPHLPHLTPEQVKLYKEQIREREVYMDEKRRKESEEIELEDKEREEVRERNRLRMEQMDKDIQHLLDETDLEL